MRRKKSSKRVYLITGATGFIGSCLLRELIARGEETHIILRREANLWRVKDLLAGTTVYTNDLSDPLKLSNVIKKIRPDVIYHLAAYGAYPLQSDADLCIKTNFTGTWNLLKAASDIDYELFINTGSSSEYGFKDSPMREDDMLEPASYYAATKGAQTLLASYFAKEKQKPIVTLRPFSVYGPYEDMNRFVPTLLNSLNSGRRMKLVSPDISRDWIYVDDMVGAYLLVDKLKKYGGEVFNIGTAVQNSIKDMVRLAVEVTGKTTAFEWGKMKNRIWDTPCWIADISKAKKLLGWSPKVGLSDGLERTWQWIRRWK